MELINPYAVVRNSATFEAYRTYSRKAALAGQPYITLAILLTTVGPLSLTGVRLFLHRPPMDLRVVSACYLLPVFLAGVFMLVGVVKIRRYRREHPIPDEWRQVPRSNPLRRAQRTPQTPA